MYGPKEHRKKQNKTNKKEKKQFFFNATDIFAALLLNKALYSQMSGMETHKISPG